MVGSGADGGDDLVGFGGREHELQVGRWLLDDLEQGVESRRGDHVGLVDDIHLEPRRGRREERAFPQVAGIVHKPVGGGVDLGDVHGHTASDRHALLAYPARLGRRPVHAVQGGGEDARGRRLAAAARTAEQVGVVDAARLQRLHEGTGHVLLTDDLGEGRWTVPVVQRAAHMITDLLRRSLASSARWALPGIKAVAGFAAPAKRTTPRAPARACLPLLPSGPGGVHEGDAARGVCQ